MPEVIQEKVDYVQSEKLLKGRVSPDLFLINEKGKEFVSNIRSSYHEFDSSSETE